MAKQISQNKDAVEAREALPKERYNVVRDLGRTAKALSGFQCCNIEMTGLTILPDTPVKSWMELIRELDSMWFASEVKDLMIKFYIGDAIHQGCEVFGESHAQAFGTDMHWSLGYISNIVWTCKKVPKENRNLKLNSWRFYQDLASLAPDEQKYYVALAVELKESGNDRWYSEVKATINDDKIKQQLRRLKPDELPYWEKMLETFEPSWTALRDWVEGTKPVPLVPKPLPDWIRDEMDTITRRIDLTSDMKDAVVSALFDLADNIKAKTVEL